jgi:hypothetical protein
VHVYGIHIGLTVSAIFVGLIKKCVKVIVGVCAMAKKTLSKPMKEILTRLEEFEYIKTVIFTESVILKVSPPPREAFSGSGTFLSDSDFVIRIGNRYRCILVYVFLPHRPFIRENFFVLKLVNTKFI